MSIKTLLKSKSALVGVPWYEVLIWIAIGLFAVWFGATIL